MNLSQQSLDRLLAWDRAVCVRMNGIAHVAATRFVFVGVSRLGNGVFWYLLMAALLVVQGTNAIRPVLHMVGVGIVCMVLYKALKASTSRPRPYAAHADITLCAAPLDQFSFPSGHTLHATGFSLVVLWYYPALFWLVVPFSVLVAVSRLVLGLHYPSDVIAGAFLGAAVAMLSICLGLTV